jgi:membrane protein YqaA with SNARE-associated domain
MRQFAAALISFGLPGLFFFAIIDGAGVPMPGGLDVLVVFLAIQRHHGVPLLTLTAVAGSLIGNAVLFSIARKGGELYLDKRTQSGAAARFRHWFHHYGLLTVFIAALVPLPIMPMKIFVLSAGALGSTFIGFLATLFIARLLRYFGLAWLGEQMGEEAIPYLRQHLWQLTAAAIVLFFILYLMVKIADRLRHRRRVGSTRE